jgi:hypothetical protein
MDYRREKAVAGAMGCFCGSLLGPLMMAHHIVACGEMIDTVKRKRQHNINHIYGKIIHKWEKLTKLSSYLQRAF